MSEWVYVHNLDPIIFNIGPLRVGWYGMMYAVSFLLGYFLLSRWAKEEGSSVAEKDVGTLVTYVILGVVLGARLGWVVFYGGMPYFVEPWRIFETWKGGMSFHGGLLAVVFALWLFARRNRIPILSISDFVAPLCALGLFFGRMGNFINGELYGKPTDQSWGVLFPKKNDPEQLWRHPSQIYEGVLEGLVIFGVLYLLRRRVRIPGFHSALLLLLYGIFRIAVEFVRLPDRDIGYTWGFVTRGQFLSLPMILVGGVWIVYLLVTHARGRAKTA